MFISRCQFFVLFPAKHTSVLRGWKCCIIQYKYRFQIINSWNSSLAWLLSQSLSLPRSSLLQRNCWMFQMRSLPANFKWYSVSLDWNQSVGAACCIIDCDSQDCDLFDKLGRCLLWLVIFVAGTLAPGVSGSIFQVAQRSGIMSRSGDNLTTNYRTQCNNVVYS